MKLKLVSSCHNFFCYDCVRRAEQFQENSSINLAVVHWFIVSTFQCFWNSKRIEEKYLNKEIHLHRTTQNKIDLKSRIMRTRKIVFIISSLWEAAKLENLKLFAAKLRICERSRKDDWFHSRRLSVINGEKESYNWGNSISYSLLTLLLTRTTPTKNNNLPQSSILVFLSSCCFAKRCSFQTSVNLWWKSTQINIYEVISHPYQSQTLTSQNPLSFISPMISFTKLEDEQMKRQSKNETKMYIVLVDMYPENYSRMFILLSYIFNSILLRSLLLPKHNNETLRKSWKSVPRKEIKLSEKYSTF